MIFSLAQKQALKADINAAEVAGQPNNDTGNAVIAAAYNLAASPAHWVWRTNVTRIEIYTKQNDLAVAGEQTGFFKWDVFKAQSVTEQNAFIQMFMGDQANFGLKNLRDGIAEIFKGTAGNLAMQAHILAIGRRQATRLEKLFAIDTPGSGAGRGTTADPDTLVLEGTVTVTQIEEARNS